MLENLLACRDHLDNRDGIYSFTVSGVGLLEGLSQLLTWVAVSTLLPFFKYKGSRMEDFTFNMIVVLCGLVSEAASLVLLAIIHDKDFIFMGICSVLFQISSVWSTIGAYLEGEGAGFYPAWHSIQELKRTESMYRKLPWGSFHYNRVRAFEQI